MNNDFRSGFEKTAGLKEIGQLIKDKAGGAINKFKKIMADVPKDRRNYDAIAGVNKGRRWVDTWAGIPKKAFIQDMFSRVIRGPALDLVSRGSRDAPEMVKLVTKAFTTEQKKAIAEGGWKALQKLRPLSKVAKYYVGEATDPYSNKMKHGANVGAAIGGLGGAAWGAYHGGGPKGMSPLGAGLLGGAVGAGFGALSGKALKYVNDRQSKNFRRDVYQGVHKHLLAKDPEANLALSFKDKK